MKVAAIQLTSKDDWRENLQSVEQKLKFAVDGGAQLVVLPENALMFAGTKMRGLAESDDQAALLARFSDLAKQYAIYLVIGSHPSLLREDGLEVENGRVRQSCLVYGPDGELKARYDKIHLFDVMVSNKNGQYQESKVIEPGPLEPVVLDLGGLKLGLSICYDVRFPEMYRALADLKADLVLVPAAFTYKTGEAHWHTLLKCRAIENQFYVMGVNQCGQHTIARETFGHSACYSPWGDNLGQLQHEPGVLLVDIDIEKNTACRETMPVHQHRRFKV